MGETLKTLSLSQEELGKVKPFISKPGKKDTGKGKIEIKNHVLIFVLDKDGQYYGYLAKKGETEFKLISKYTFTQGYVCFNGGISKADLVVKEQDLGKEIVDSIKDNLSKYNVTTQRPSQTYKLPVEEKTNITEGKEKEPKKTVEKAEKKEPKEKTKKEPAKEPKPEEKKPVNKVKQEQEKQNIINTPQENKDNKEENKKSKVKENKGGNMKTNIVYDENNKEVAQISSDKVGGFEGNIYIIGGVAVGDDGKKGKKLGKWNEETKTIEPIKKSTKKSKAPAKKAPEASKAGTKHSVTRTGEDGSVKGSYVDEKHGEKGFVGDLKRAIAEYVTDNVNLKRADKTQDYTEAEEKKIQKLAAFAVNKIVKDAGLSKDEMKVVDARQQELVNYAVKCVKIKYPVEKKEVVVDFDYLAGKITERVQKGARMAFTMSDIEKAELDKILAKATPEQIRKIAYGKDVEAAKASRGLEFDKLVAKEELAKAGGAIKISGSPELQSVVRKVGIVDNEATGTAHVSINELKNLDGVYYKLGIVPAYASALVDFVVKKHKNPKITDEEKGKLVDIAHELVLNEILTAQDVSVLVEAAALAKSFTSPIYKFKDEINGYTEGGVYHTGIVDDLVKVGSYDLRSHKAFEAAEQFVASHEDELVKKDEDRDVAVEKWAEYFIKVAQTKKHLNPVVGEVAAMAELTEDQQNAIIGFVNEYKNLDDILDLTVATSSPIENKVVVEKVRQLAKNMQMSKKLDGALASETYTKRVKEIEEIADEEEKAKACHKAASEIVKEELKKEGLSKEEVESLVSDVEENLRKDAGLGKVAEEKEKPEISDDKKQKIQDMLERIRASKEYSRVVSDIASLKDGQDKECHQRALEFAAGELDKEDYSDEEQAALVNGVEKKIRERVGLPENVVAPVEEETAGAVETPVEETPTETPTEEVAPEDITEVVPEETESGETEEVKPEDAAKDEDIEDIDEFVKPRVIDPSKVIVSEPFNINGGKSSDYQGAFVIGPHPEASNKTERGLYFVDVKKLAAAGKTLDDLKTNFNPEELFGDKDPSKRFGYVVRRAQIGTNLFRQVNFLRLDYYDTKDHHGVGESTDTKNSRIQSYKKKDAQKAYKFLEDNDMLAKTEKKMFMKGHVKDGVLKIASAVFAGLVATNLVVGAVPAQTIPSEQQGVDRANAKYAQVVTNEDSLFSYKDNQVVGISKMHEILSDKKAFEQETRNFWQRIFAPKVGERRKSEYNAVEAAKGYGRVIGGKAAAELHKHGVTITENGKEIVYYPTNPANPNFLNDLAAREYLKGNGFDSDIAKALIDGYKEGYATQRLIDAAGTVTSGTSEPGNEQDTPTQPVDPEYNKEIKAALGNVTKSNADGFTTIYKTSDNKYLYAENGDNLVKVTLGEGDSLAEQVANTTDTVVEAKDAAKLFRDMKQSKNFKKYLDLHYGEEGMSDQVRAYVVNPAPVNGVYTPYIICEKLDEAGQVTAIDMWEGLRVQLTKGTDPNDNEIYKAAFLGEYIDEIGSYPAENYFPKENEEKLEDTETVEEVKEETATATIAAKAARKVVKEKELGE